MKISVAMAAYNGESFILEQLASILNQLSAEDEVVISVDPSEDNTMNVLTALSGEEPRIKLIEGEGKGLIKNFENALNNCTGDVIFLSDQDDKWLDDKVSTVMKHFDNGADLVLHNCIVADGMLREKADKTFFELHGSKKGVKENIIKNSYMGCCMAFRKEIIDMALPFPEDIPMHDQWLGLIAERCGANVIFEEKPLLLYRRHGGNASSTEHAGILTMIKCRINITKNLRKG